MKFKLYYCPICEARVKEIGETVWHCDHCKIYLEIVDIHYSAVDQTLTMKYLFIKDEEYEQKMSDMQRRNTSIDN